MANYGGEGGGRGNAMRRRSALLAAMMPQTSALAAPMAALQSQLAGRMPPGGGPPGRMPPGGGGMGTLTQKPDLPLQGGGLIARPPLPMPTPGGLAGGGRVANAPLPMGSLIRRRRPRPFSRRPPGMGFGPGY